MTDQRNEPTLVDLLRDVLDARLDEVHSAIIARVVSYDADARTAEIEPCVKAPLQRRDGSIMFEGLPVLPNVKILSPGGGGFFVSFPVQAGDFVLAIVLDLDSNEWRRLGGVGVEPGDTRRHSISSVVALPLMLYPDLVSVLVPGSSSDLVLGRQGGTAIHIRDDDTVRIGSRTASKGVGRVGDQVKITIPTGAVGGSEGLPTAPVICYGTIEAGSASVYADD